MSTTRSEEVFVLYASQMGTSEEAAQKFCDEVPTALSSKAIQELTDKKDVEITVVPTMMTLDEFLEVKSAAWTRLVVIFVSSYGMGASPMGGHRFRDLCEEWKDQKEKDDKMEQVLTGLQYALCGLGNSSFRTFFENPQTIDDGLQAAGATRVGTLGKADAYKKGDESQPNVILKWREEIWKPLAEVLVQEPPSEEVLKEMQEKTNAAL